MFGCGSLQERDTMSLNTKKYKADVHSGEEVVYDLKPAGRVQANLVENVEEP